MILATCSRDCARELTYGDEHRDVTEPYKKESVYQAGGTATDLISVMMQVISARTHF
jgi:hypothetical protein